MNEHQTELLGAYVLGVLDTDEEITVQRHLSTCEHCRGEVNDLREMEAVLGEIPPEAFLEGPPDGADLLLQRTLRDIRAERSQHTMIRRTAWAAAAAVVAVLVLVGGTLIGRNTANTITAQPAPTVSTVPGTRTASGTDTTTGASMAVTVKPAVGWVRLNVSVNGVAAGQQCKLLVFAKDGSSREAGSWLVSDTAAQKGTTLDSFALVPPADVASVRVVNFAGRTLVSVPV
jgi:predicted anti-sigma-YlaC factor YlaD